jgi:lysophospholipase L1-like esterase
MRAPFERLLLPLLLAQGAWVKLVTPRLPVAAGSNEGTIAGPGDPIGLWLLGDSTVAGVGVRDHQEGLAAQTAAALAAQLGRPVHWWAWGLSGATAATAQQLIPYLRRHSPVHPDDAVILCLGVNDALRGTPLPSWEEGIHALIEGVRQEMGEIDLLFASPPPLGEFPAFPAPLRGYLGRRAARLHNSLAEIVAQTERAHLLPPLSGLAVHHFSEDRFHPSAIGYLTWGALLADQLLLRTGQRSLTDRDS